jgi:hypothetical protein
MTKGLKIPKDTKKDKHCNDQRFEDIKGVNRSHNSKKYRQYNDH